MKIIKVIMIILAILIGVPLIIALFIKKDYAVQREITIDRSSGEVFNYIKLLRNQDNYSKWNKTDPNMKKSYSGTDGTVGFIAAWESKMKEVGIGQQEIIRITEGERIDTKLRFKEPFEAQDDAYMTTEKIDSSTTKVKWGFTGKFPYPMNLMTVMMDMDKQIGGDLEIGLNNLKAILEK